MINNTTQLASPADAAFIDENELLKRLPVSRRTLHVWRENGKLPFVKMPGGRRVLYHWPTVEAALRCLQSGSAVKA